MSFFKASVAVMREQHQPVPQERVALPIAAAVAVAEPIVVAPKERVPIPERSIDAEASLSDDVRASYISLSAELGIHQPGLVKDAALAYFRERGTRLYDGAKVKAFLDDQYGVETMVPDVRMQQMSGGTSGTAMRGRPSWGWRALRKQDVTIPQDSQQWGYSTPDKNDSIWAFDSYSKPLPLPVLITVKEVLGKFPSANFYVSDDIKSYEHREPVLDPFLLVVIEGQRFIIERWDEPGYRE